MVELLAQVPAQPNIPVTSAEVQSVWDFILKGGPMMIPLGICSLVALTVIVERLFSLRRSQIMPSGFLDELKSKFTTDHNGDAALSYCRERPGPLANILATAIKRSSEPRELLEKHIQDAGEREVFKLRKFLRSLSVIAAIAPLMGLLGTIFGMIRAFQTVAVSADSLGKTGLMATGIYQALITTAAGLMIAIPVLVSYHWISSRIDRMVVDMDQMTVDFVDDHLLAAKAMPQESPRFEIADATEEPEEVAAAG